MAEPKRHMDVPKERVSGGLCPERRLHQYLGLLFRSNVLRISIGIHKAIELTQISELHLEHPAVAIGIFIHNLRLILKLLIHLDNLTGDRAKHIRSRLDRLSDTRLLAAINRHAHFRNTNVNHITQLLLGKIRNAYRSGAISLHPNPLMGFEILQIAWNIAHVLWVVRS